MESKYTPRPLNTENVELHDGLTGLVELLAENAHDIWAQQRIADGWVFGDSRCDVSRSHPCLIPYSQLPEMEKEYDRNAVLGTIRAILALGFEIHDTSLSAQKSNPLQSPETH